ARVLRAYVDDRGPASVPTRRSSDLKLAAMDVQVLLPLKDQITWLDFAHGEVKDQHLEAIGQLTSLSRPNLSNNTLTDAGIKQLRSEEHTSELQSRENLVCRLLLEK